jgi:GTP-binding protein LepA
LAVTFFLRAQASDLIRLDIQINQESVDALALIIHREDSVRKGREIAEKMKELVPRQMFDVAIQACIGVKVIDLNRLCLFLIYFPWF